MIFSSKTIGIAIASPALSLSRETCVRRNSMGLTLGPGGGFTFSFLFFPPESAGVRTGFLRSFVGAGLVELVDLIGGAKLGLRAYTCYTHTHTGRACGKQEMMSINHRVKH